MTPTSTPVVLGIGMAAYVGCDEVLVLPEFHPTTHAGFQLAITHDDAVVTSADLHVGFMHRGFEKLFESRDYRQLMMLANRYDWFSAFTSELAIALVLEAAMGIVPPERATWSRTLLAETNRVMTTLAFLAPVLDGPAQAAATTAREHLIAAQELATGGRVHPMVTRIGGLAAPMGSEARETLARVSAAIEDALPQIVDATYAFASRLSGVAVLSRDDAIALGASGAVARASGLDIDLRRDDPYVNYAEVADLLTIPTRLAGDAQARFEVLAEQLAPSLRIMNACLARLAELGEGPIDVPLPKTVRAPEGMSYGWVEGPLGISGVLLVSEGDSMPERLKLRSASFGNARAMQSALVGTPLDLLADAVMSFFLSVGDIDR